MPINPSIAMGFQQPQIESPLNAMARTMQIQQAQEEMRLNALRARGVEQELAEGENWRNALRSGLDIETPEGQRALLTASPDKAISLFKNVAERKKAAAEAQRIESETTDRVLGTYRSVLPGIQTPEQMAEWYTRQFQDARLANSPVRAHSLEQKIAAIPRDPAKFAEFKAQVEMGMDKYLTYKATSERGIPLLPGSKLVRPTAFGETTPPITEPRQQGPQTGVTEGTPGTPKQAYRISSDPDGKLRVETAPIPETAKLTPKDAETQRLEAKKDVLFPKVQSAHKANISKIDTLIADAETLAKHPGIGGITGLIGGRTPGITGPARQAEALLEQLKARGTFKELSEMRLSSPTGAALGNVSDREGNKLEAGFAALKTTQNEEDFRKALDKLVTELKVSKNLMNEAFEDDYAYKTAGPATPAAPKPATPKPAAAPKPAAPAATGGRRSLDDIMSGKR